MFDSHNDETYEVNQAKLIRESDSAFLFDIDDNSVWVPKSQMENLEWIKKGRWGVLRYCNFEIPVWLAEDKGLI